MSEPRRGALEGVRVVDFSRVLAGPYATMFLADFGAEVIKLERPGTGDDTRAYGPPFHEGEATYYLALNRNKASVAFDLTDRAHRQWVHDLLVDADVLVENFKTGTLDRYGFGYEQIAERYPRLVYASITGFGSRDGANLPGYDLIAQATGGLMSITGHPETGPTKAGVALGDAVTGLHATIGILAALRHRDHTGQGQHVEVNLLSSVLASLTNQISAHLLAGSLPRPMGNSHPSIAPYEPIMTKDRQLAIAAATEGQFALLARAIGLPELPQDPRFSSNAARVTNHAALIAVLTERFAARTADEWFELLSELGVPCGPINDLAQAVALAAELGLEPVAHPTEGPGAGQVRNPIQFSATPATYRTAPPPLPTGDEPPPAWRARSEQALQDKEIHA